MLRRTALLFVLCVTPVAFAQDELQQIRQQMAHLQQLLDAAENAPAPKRNVTQIGATRKRKQESGLVIKIYDLGDLFAVAPPYPAQVSSDLNPTSRTPLFDTQTFSSGGMGGGMGGMGGGFFSVSPLDGAANATRAATALSAAMAGQAGTNTAVKTSQDELIVVIKETISPDVWKEGGKITKLGNAYVVSADEDTHTQIEALLNLLRGRWGTLRTVSVRAWWLSLTHAELFRFLDIPEEKISPEGPPVFGVGGEEFWKEILQISEKPIADKTSRLRYQAALTCYNGQTVSAVAGVQDLAVSKMEVLLSRNENDEAVGKIGYRPELATIQEGLAFQITPATNVSGKTVLLDVHSRLTIAASDDKRESGRESDADFVLPSDVVHQIDRRRLLIHRLSTTARVPVDRPYLVGGMSIPPLIGQDGPLPLYLFVKVSVQELRNDQESAGRPIDEPLAPKSEKPVEPEKK